MQLGEKIRSARKAKGLTQSMLAEIMGVETSTVSRWENGSGIDAYRIPELAKHLGKSPEYFTETQGSDDSRIAALEARLAALEKPQAPTSDRQELITLIGQLNDNEIVEILKVVRRKVVGNNPKRSSGS